jgi:aminoglycoside phosphotransferase (APT) family kinase protein
MTIGHPVPGAVTVAEVRRLLARQGLEVEAIERVEQGMSRRAFRVIQGGEVRYLKLIIPTKIACQLALSGILAEADVPAVPLLAAGEDTQSGWGFLLQGAARGTALGRADGAAQNRRGLLRQAGALLARVHRIKLPGFGRLVLRWSQLQGRHERWQDYLFVKAPDLEGLVNRGILLQEIAKKCAAHLVRTEASNPPTGALLHNDFHGGNIFASRGTLTEVIDWDDAISGDPMFDLAISSHWLEEGFADLRAGYDGPIDEEKLAACQVLVFLTKVERAERFRPKRLPYNVARLKELINQTEVQP